MRVHGRYLPIVAANFLFFFSIQPAGAQTATPSAKARKSPPTKAERAGVEADLVEKMKASRERLQKILAAYKEELPGQVAEVVRRRKLYETGEIPRASVDQAEWILATTRKNMSDVIQWIVEDEIVLDEAVAREEILRGPSLGVGGYLESQTLIRYNGGAKWSLADAGKIEKFFLGRFGRALPVSAMGQTSAHDRMRFDHHDAMDVAVLPDSDEGRALMEYLRRTGIPFIAFRGRVAGSATGAHIHIGKPSLRLAAPK
jgi:hypothetical protein